MHSPLQLADIDALNRYPLRIIVAGSRGYDDYAEFSTLMHDSIATLPQRDIAFITGLAKTGADAMIVKWCEEHGFPWKDFPAEWDNLNAPGAVIVTRKWDGKLYNKRAGMMRNIVMAKHATHLIAFWDDESRGTLQMLSTAMDHKLHLTLHLIDIGPKGQHHGRQPQSGGTYYLGQHRKIDAKVGEYDALSKLIRQHERQRVR